MPEFKSKDGRFITLSMPGKGTRITLARGHYGWDLKIERCYKNKKTEQWVNTPFLTPEAAEIAMDLLPEAIARQRVLNQQFKNDHPELERDFDAKRMVRAEQRKVEYPENVPVPVQPIVQTRQTALPVANFNDDDIPF